MTKHQYNAIICLIIGFEFMNLSIHAMTAWLGIGTFIIAGIFLWLGVRSDTEWRADCE